MIEMKAPYLNAELPIAERVEDLISRLELEEKVFMMTSDARGVPRLNIPPYNFWNEALHGVGRNGRATVFPQAIGMAATWDPELVEHVADTIAEEARAKYNAAVQRFGTSGQYQGLTFWSPNINIFRDPRWGRGQETWGEDPYLTGEMGSAYVRGLQGKHPKFLKTAACAKHYAVHSGPEKHRHTFNAVVSERDLMDTYLPAFKKLVAEAKVEAVMGAYNRINGEPCCASQTLLVDILRDRWQFEGHVVSDCGAVSDIHNGHKVTKDAAESAALALKAGCDMSCIYEYEYLNEALERGLICEADIDRSLRRTLATRFKLGMFDPPELVPFSSISMDIVGNPNNRELSCQAAVKSVVLLKNKDGILPIKNDVRSIAVVGPNAGNIDVLLGNYFGSNDHLVTMLEGIVGTVPEGVKVQYRPGCQLIQSSFNPLDWSVYEAGSSDITIACMGISPLLEGEEGDATLSTEQGDRADIGLPAVQVEYIKKMAVQGAKIILVLFGGSPISLGEVENMVQAVVYAWYPGQEGGRAVADILFGKCTPSGKLPVTFPMSLADLPPFEDYSMTGRTYRYAEAEPLFPFGFGLSYTRFTYSELVVSQHTLHPDEPLDLTVKLENSGDQDGEEVVQVYLTDLEASSIVPKYKLVAFRRVGLGAGESRRLSFTLATEDFKFVDESGSLVLEPGQFRLYIGGCSPDPRGQILGASPLLETYVEVTKS
jgi:beta-glucosidase